MLRAILRNAGVEKRDAETLGISLAVRFEIGALDGTCTHTLPADNGLLFYSATRAKWWEVLVTLQSSLPALFCDTRFTVGQPDHVPYRYWLRGWELHPQR